MMYVDDWRKRTIMDDLDTCVKLEMTKTGAVPGQMEVSYLKQTHFFELLITCCRLVHPWFWECCFTVLRSLRRCVLTSPDQANGSFTTLGIASCALSYLYPYIRDHYDLFCVVPMEYSWYPTSLRWSLQCCIDYNAYIKCVQGIMVTP